jgi:tetratricopeptide (TPR) repeat protein
MVEVRAFVGHSFTDEDKDVVSQFLEYFDALRKINSSFSWVHARAAEPKQLAEKVLALVKECNTFIAICTEKELAVASSAGTRFLKRFVCSQDALQSKTSDWVIQEIGLAVGRDMHLILLVENGVRLPGGLQGNIERISFSRSAPEKSFNRVAEMIHAIGLDQATTSSSPVTAATTAPEPPKKDEPVSEADLVPQAGWTEDDFEFAQFRSILRKVASATLKETFVKLPGKTAEARQAIWDARDDCYRVIFGRGGDLERLRSLSENHPSITTIKLLYARALRHFDKHAAAAKLFEDVAVETVDDEERFDSLCRAASAHQENGDPQKAAQILRQLRADANSGGKTKLLKELYSTMLDLADLQKDQYFQLGVLEGQIDQSPASFRTRFALAYLHSQVGNEDLALHHYLQIPVDERQSMDWNNLGVAYNHFKVKGRAVQAFRKSEATGETLAMANLGYQLLNAGFVSEAAEICNKALAIEGFHANVGQLTVALREYPETESKSVEATIDQAKERAAYYTSFGNSLGMTELAEPATTWVGSECELSLKIVGDQVSLYGSFQRGPNALSAAMGLVSSNVTVRQELQYTGILRGRAVVGLFQRISDEKFPTLLGAQTEPQRFLMIVSPDTLTVLYPSENSAKPITFKRREAVPQLQSPSSAS